MNTNYYQPPVFPGSQGPSGIPNQQGPFPGNQLPSGTPNQQSIPPINQGQEQSYIEDILRFNRGKVGKFYMTFPDSSEWRDKVFTGVMEHAGIDNIIVSDPSTGKWYLLLKIYLDYVEFGEPIVFTPGVTQAQAAQAAQTQNRFNK